MPKLSTMAVLLLAIVTLPATGSRAAEPPRVVATIKPIHSLVAMVMQGVGEPRLLIGTGASPHTYALKPSDARALQRADVVFWVGEGLETFLEKPLRTLPENARVVELAEAPGVTLLPYRAPGQEAHEHGDPHDHGDAAHEKQEHDHAHGGANMHIWLDGGNAEAIVRAAAAALSEADPGRAELYRANAEQAVIRLEVLDGTLREQLTPLSGRPYIVFHDAYQYLEQRYGLTPAGSITVDPERQPSARRIAAIRESLRAGGVVCVFSEPQFEPKLVRTLVEGTDVRTAVLDAEGGVGVPPGPDAYPTIMRNIADALRDCLAPPS